VSSSNKRHRDFEQTMAFTNGIIDILLVLALIVAFVVVTLVVFVVLTFVRYHKQKALWIALGVSTGLCIIGVLLTKLFSIGAFLLLMPVGLMVLLIASLVVWLRESTTLLPENLNIVDRVLHSSWWDFEDKPLDGKREQLAA
jgi:magnesium-transporting ATPase (P-type)